MIYPHMPLSLPCRPHLATLPPPAELPSYPNPSTSPKPSYSSSSNPSSMPPSLSPSLAATRPLQPEPPHRPCRPHLAAPITTSPCPARAREERKKKKVAETTFFHPEPHGTPSPLRPY